MLTPLPAPLCRAARTVLFRGTNKALGSSSALTAVPSRVHAEASTLLYEGVIPPGCISEIACADALTGIPGD